MIAIIVAVICFGIATILTKFGTSLIIDSMKGWMQSIKDAASRQ